MSYKTATLDEAGDFGPEPIVTLTVSGTHDVSRLVHLLRRGTIEQGVAGNRLARQLRKTDGGRAALELLKQHGGPDLTQEPVE